MIEIFEAPTEPAEFNRSGSLFLAGGITGVWDWQARAVDLLAEKFLPSQTRVRHAFNPRRANFDVNDASAMKAQIAWEHKWLHEVDQILFWFSDETVQPITLFELGAALERRYWPPYFTATSDTIRDGQRIIVGCHPGYSRRVDVVEQLSLAKCPCVVHDTLEGLLCDVL